MGSSPLSTILLIALMVVAFYFLLLRPQKKRQQAQQKTMNEIQPGTRVLLGSGIFGTVVSVGEKQAVLETSPGVQVTVLKQAIARIVQPGDEFAEPVEETEIEEESVTDPEPIEPSGYQQPTGETPTYDNPTFGNEPKKD
jgi:preprotein translocase subunit YajC